MKAISVPLRSYIRVCSYYLTKDLDKEKLKEMFSELAKSLDLDLKEIRWREGVGIASGKNHRGENIFLKMEQAMDIYTYQIWFPEKRDVPFLKNPMVDAQIFTYSSFPGNEAIELHLKGKEEFGSLLKDGLKAYTSFELLRGERDNFVLVADPLKVSEEDFEKIVEEVIKLENCYYLLRDQRQRYILASDRINQIEASIAGKIGTINLNLPKATPENLKEWLHSLSTLLGDVSGVLKEVQHYSADTMNRIEVIMNILKEWGETSLEGLHPLGNFYGRATLTLGDDYQRLSRRIDGIKGEMMDMITILRTKVDLITQDQSLDLQKSMDETIKT